MQSVDDDTHLALDQTFKEFKVMNHDAPPEHPGDNECLSSEDGMSTVSSSIFKTRSIMDTAASLKFRGFRNPTGVRKAAQDLQPHCPDVDLMRLAFFLGSLGKVGAGLREALRNNPAVGRLFRLLYGLQEAAEGAVVNVPNCHKLAMLGRDILQLIDHDGRHRVSWGVETLEFLVSLSEEAVLTVEGYSRPGWLLRAVCNERMKEDFEGLHKAVCDVVQTQRLDWGSAPPLPLGDYRDEPKAVRRLLKGLGEGSVSTGLHVLADKKDHQQLKELADLLGTSVELLLKELKNLPSQDVDVDVWYANIMDDTAALLEPEDEPANHFMELFACYDKNNSGALEFEEFCSLLADSGLLTGKKPGEVEDFARRHFEIAAPDGRLVFGQFVRFYDTLLTRNGAQQLRFYFTPQQQEDLKNIFHRFASFGTRQAEMKDIDGAHFLKLCKDCNLLSSGHGRTLTSTDVDIVFAKVKTKGQRRIKYQAFLTALTLLAERKGVTFDSFVRAILAVEGPVAQGTKADFVRFHDDKSTYTGVYARGGPTMKDGFLDWSEVVDRSRADVRGVKQTPKAARKTNPGAILEPITYTPSPLRPPTPSSGASVKSAFGRSVNSSPLSGSTPPLPGSRSATPTRLTWGSPSTPKSRPPSARRASMFELTSTPRASDSAAARGGLLGTPSSRASTPVHSEAAYGATEPCTPGSQAGEGERPVLRRVRRSSAGAALAGSPEPNLARLTIRTSPATPLSGPLRGGPAQPRAPRSASLSPRAARRMSGPAAPLRAAATEGLEGTPGGEQQGLGEGLTPALRRLSSPATRRASDGVVLARGTPAQELYLVFERFATFGLPPSSASTLKKAEMDGMRFAKLWRDSGLLGAGLGATSVDLIFTKVKAKGERKITFRQFKTAVELVAAELGTVPTEVMQVLLLMDGPTNSGTRPEHVRFHKGQSPGVSTPRSSVGTPRSSRSTWL